MNKKKIMIMGAGIYQVPLIKKAKDMGLQTIVVSTPGNYPGIALADCFYPINTTDKEAVLEIAQKEQIGGICTSGTDVAVKTIGYVCSKMGLAGITEQAANLVTNKALMKEALLKENVSTAAFEKVFSFHEAKEAAECLGYPVIVKAVDSSGSRGISKAEDVQGLEKAFTAAMNITKQMYVLVEEYIDACEIGVDAYVGEHGLLAFYPHDKFTLHWKGVTIPVGHQFPYQCEERLYQELYLQISKAVEALGLKNCPLNADVFVKGNKVWIIEIGGRTGATCIPELISIYQGFDWYENLILAALGEPVSFEGNQEKDAIAKLIFSPLDGKVVSIEEERLARLCQRGFQWQLDVKVGDSVEQIKNGTDRIGHLIGSESREEAFDAYVSEFRKCIWLDKGNLEELHEIFMS